MLIQNEAEYPEGSTSAFYSYSLTLETNWESKRNQARDKILDLLKSRIEKTLKLHYTLLSYITEDKEDSKATEKNLLLVSDACSLLKFLP